MKMSRKGFPTQVAGIVVAALVLGFSGRVPAAADDFSTAVPDKDSLRRAVSGSPAVDGEIARIELYSDHDGVDVLKEPRDPQTDDERQDLVLTQLRRGEKVIVTGKIQEWYKVKVNRREWDAEAKDLRDYTEGWVRRTSQESQPADYFIPTHPQSTPENPALPAQLADLKPDDCRTAFLNALTRFVGVPYVWGGTTHRGVDCSGLVVAALLEANCVAKMPPRVAADQQKAAARLSGPDQMQAGDLIFHGDPAHHVVVFLGKSGGYMAIEAPHTGAFVNIHPWSPGPGQTYGALLPRLEK